MRKRRQWRHQFFSLIGGPEARTVFVTVLALILTARRRQQAAITLIFAVGGAGIINTGLKRVVRRARPEKLLGIRQAGGYSFPSGHTTGSFVFFGILPFLLAAETRRPKFIAPTLAISVLVPALVARSRIVLQHHYPGDIVGGYGVGAAWLAIVISVLNGRLRRNGQA